MATIRNGKLTKVGNLVTSNAGQASGHTQMQLVQSANPLPDPGPRNLSDPTWPARNAAYQQSVQIEPKFSGDNE